MTNFDMRTPVYPVKRQYWRCRADIDILLIWARLYTDYWHKGYLLRPPYKAFLKVSVHCFVITRGSVAIHLTSLNGNPLIKLIRHSGNKGLIYRSALTLSGAARFPSALASSKITGWRATRITVPCNVGL